MGAATAAPFFMAAIIPSKFPAVAIVTGTDCCGAVGALEGVRVLAAQAPILPMSNCAMPEKCRCRYKKYVDRREDEEGRRFWFANEREAWFAGTQRRKSRGRRLGD